MRRLAPLALLAASAACPLVACHGPSPPPSPSSLTALPPLGPGAIAPPRVGGPVGGAAPLPPAQLSYGTPASVRLPAPAAAQTGGDISLDFADTDIRTVVAQILGKILNVNYTIDPAVHGTATLHTSRPLTRAQLLPMLQALLAQNGAALIESNGIFRVVPAAGAGPGTAASGVATVANGVLVPLRYASADQLAKVLQPFIGTGGRIVADPGHNTLLVTGDPAVRDTLVRLIQAFDVNELAGQSYALLPVVAGDAKDFAQVLETALRASKSGTLSGVVRVAPLERIDAVLVVAPEPAQIDAARRVFSLVQRARRAKVRAWRVYYLRNSHAEPTAYILQQAFTPDKVTALPPGSNRQAAPAGFGGTPQGAAGTGIGMSGALAPGATGIGNGGIGAGGIGTSGAAAGGVPSVLAGGLPQEPGTAQAEPPTPPPSANPLLGGLQTGAGATTATAEAMRIIPDDQNNAELVYGTPAEQDTVAAMLRKIDIMPLQVRIDAVIAEVTLNDQLQYGTQFYFKSGGINGILNNAVGPLGEPSSVVLGTGFPGFIISGHNQGGAPLAISALQAVTQVRVLSSPEIMVLDGQPARLQVGNLVPYLTSSSQGTIVPNAPIINSVQYQPTGVIMRVTPHIDTGGEVTLDVAQEVSQVSAAPQAPGVSINSPTFSERSVTSRVVLEDGQTVGLAGLISDTMTRGNQGIPWLKDIPLLGFLAGTQNNTRARTELLVLITPHVIHDERDARALTEDLRDSLTNAAALPQELNGLPPSGSADPNARLRQRLDLR